MQNSDLWPHERLLGFLSRLDVVGIDSQHDVSGPDFVSLRRGAALQYLGDNHLSRWPLAHLNANANLYACMLVCD